MDQIVVNFYNLFDQAADERTWCQADIVESQLGNTGVQLHQQRQRLTDTSSGTENGDFGGLWNKSSVSSRSLYGL